MIGGGTLGAVANMASSFGSFDMSIGSSPESLGLFICSSSVSFALGVRVGSGPLNESIWIGPCRRLIRAMLSATGMVIARRYLRGSRLGLGVPVVIFLVVGGSLRVIDRETPNARTRICVVVNMLTYYFLNTVGMFFL